MPHTDDFAGRVNYAAAVISAGRRTSRAFDSCFENHDGDEVVAILLRRAEKNPRLAANIWRYLAKETALGAAERLKDIPTREMAAHAAETREKARREFDALMARRDAEQAAIRQRGKDAGYKVEKTGEFEFSAFRPDGSTVGAYYHEDSAWHFAGKDAETLAA